MSRKDDEENMKCRAVMSGIGLGGLTFRGLAINLFLKERQYVR